MESVINPVTVMRADCPFCGNISSRFATAENGGKVSVCDECGEKADSRRIRIVWVEKEIKSRSKVIYSESIMGGHYEAVAYAD